jgi:ABC-type polysaccharide/polyol phosphate export permease
MAAQVTAHFLSPERAANVQRFLRLTRISALRSLKVRYRGSALGVLWSFGNPVMMTIVYTTLFGTAFARYYDGSVTRYLLAVFVALVAVTFFMNTTSEALMTVVANGSILNKIAVPPAVFPLSSVVANLYQQSLTTFPVVLIVAIVVARDPVRVALVPVVLLGLALLTTGFALVLSAMYVFFRDLSYLWGIVGFIFWLTSPMFYPAEVVPERIRFWFNVNPLAQQISAIREVALAHGAVRFELVGIALASGVLAFAIGVVLFRATRRDFMDLI